MSLRGSAVFGSGSANWTCHPLRSKGGNEFRIDSCSSSRVFSLNRSHLIMRPAPKQTYSWSFHTTARSLVSAADQPFAAVASLSAFERFVFVMSSPTSAPRHGSLPPLLGSAGSYVRALLTYEGERISPSGKVLAVGGGVPDCANCGAPGFQIFHFNGSSPITHYTGLLHSSEKFVQFAWGQRQPPVRA